MEAEIRLRQISPDDGPKIAALGEQTPDTGQVAFHNIYYYDTYATTMALYSNASGVVVEAADHDGIVGMGMMNCGECQYEGALLPYAYLFGLSVHPDYRRRGIAAQISAWRIEKVRSLFGNDVAIFAGIQHGNEGSLRNAAKWSSQRIEGRTIPGVVKMRNSAPAPTGGLTVRSAALDDYEEIAQKQNHYHCEMNLYPPRTAQELNTWHQAMPFGVHLRDYFIVVDNEGNIAAGMSATAEGLLTAGHMVRMPRVLRLANMLLRILPADGISKRIHVKDLWYAPGQLEAAKYLWESVRWLWRKEGTMMMAFHDTQGELGKIINAPFYMPIQPGSLVVAGPSPMGEERLIYLHI